jgi:hypothetical protein
MKSTAETTSLFDAHGEDSSEGGTNVQPSDPGKISFTSAKSITDCPRLWQIVVHEMFNQREDVAEVCRLCSNNLPESMNNATIRNIRN